MGKALIFVRSEEDLATFSGMQNVVNIGTGKINATFHTTVEILERRPKLIVNFGAATSEDLRPGSIVEATEFCQVDMNFEHLGFEAGVTPDERGRFRIECPVRTSFDKARCLSKDAFVVAPFCPEPGMPEVRDSEAFAIAKVCETERVPFVCVKYVIDGARPNEWSEHRSNAVDRFIEVFHQLVSRF